MPDKATLARVEEDQREGKSVSTQAGEFVREEIHHIREGKHGARSAAQAIAIGLSKARRAGIPLPPPGPGHASDATRQHAVADLEAGRDPEHQVSKKRSRASLAALQHEGTAAASKRSLARHARIAGAEHTAAERSASAKKGARTKRQAAAKAARAPKQDT